MEDKLIWPARSAVWEMWQIYAQFYSEYFLEGIDIDGGITLKCILRKQDVDFGLGSSAWE